MIEEVTDRCMTQRAQSVGNHAKYRLSQQKVDLSIVEIVINQNQDSDYLIHISGLEFFFFLLFLLLLNSNS